MFSGGKGTESLAKAFVAHPQIELHLLVNAYDDGFLTDPKLSTEIVAANGDLYVDLYENVNLANRQHFSWDFGQDLFGTPRIVKFGASVSF